MNTVMANWEDDENNRIVELAVECRFEDETVEIVSVTPRSITFIDATTREPQRTLGIHTAAGRRLLTRVCVARGGLDAVRQTILEREVAAV